MGKGKQRSWIGGSVCAGLAYGTVFTNVVFFIPLCVAGGLYLRQRGIKVVSKEALSVWGCIVVPYGIIALLTSFYIFVYPDVFREEIMVAEQFFGISSGTLLIKSFVRFFAVLSDYVGLPLVITALIGTILWKSLRLFLAVCYVSLFILFVKFGQSGPPLRFILPIVPLILFSSVYLIDKVRREKGISIAAIIFLVVAFYPATLTVAEALHFKFDTGENATRLQAGRWINRNIPEGATIGMCSLPTSFKAPPFHFLQYRLAVAMDLKDLARSDSVADYIVHTDVEGRAPFFENLSLPIELIQEFEHTTWIHRLLPRKRLYGIANPPIRIYKVIHTPVAS